MADRKLWFVHFAQWVSHITGRPLTFLLALASIVVWAMLGPFFGFSDTWQLVINTATTIITFLMVFVIQNTQNRDTAAMHIKIDELIRVTQKARNVLLDLEELDDKTLDLLRKDYEKLARKAKSHTSTPIRAEEVPGRPGRSKAPKSKKAMTERENAASRPEALKQKPSYPKRFYEHVAIKDEGDGAAVLLDGKTVRTPGKAPFVLPNAALAEAIAEEWRGQGARIDPQTMPLTRLANSVIDGVKGNEGAVIDDILKYAGSDLLCYRAEGPKGLVALQSKHWDPILAFAKQDLGAKMRLSEGVMHVEQPPTSLDAHQEAASGHSTRGASPRSTS